ncbi:MAG: hypothetical protein JWN08_3120 [Frankiales bacterium]|nr:hypothetical protein [Frankiales bacterium]
MLENALPRTALTVLLVLCGAASFSSMASAGPALAGSTEGPEVRSSTSVARVLTPPAAPQAPPALQPTGTNADGWATYRLGAGRVPDRLLPGRGFRGEISWLQGRLVRKARIYVPRSAPATAPLLVSLHGLGASLQKVEAQQRWSTLSMQQGFVLVWGAGYKGSWNAGPCCGAAVREGVDDLGYLDRLLQVTGALHAVDRRRVHLAGFSNGAMMAYRYACGRPGRMAGVLAVAGTHTAPCRPTTATAVLVVHGADDPTVPLAGTRYSASLRSALPPARRAAALWTGTGAGVRSVVLTGFAHGWPTAANGRYDTSGRGWAFLEAHPRP